MSEENHIAGKRCYLRGNTKTQQWFQKQWAMWPKRADIAFTTNLSFHHGGIQAFREQHGCDPDMSSDLAANIKYLDGNPA